MRVRVKSYWQRRSSKSKILIIIIGVFIFVGFSLIAAYIALQMYSQAVSNSSVSIRQWFNNPAFRAGLITYREQCTNAPFILPSDGFIGLLWRDPSGPYNTLNRHTGIDIFGDGEPGNVPVYAVYDGYLTRLDNWVSSVIIRHDDPLHPGTTIWSYYTHMASQDGSQSFIEEVFPPGSSEKFVKQGTLLGHQGIYAGSAAFRVGLHVHLSLVKSEGNGAFMNEAVLDNTIDPSPYFGMQLNIDDLPERPIQCS